MTTQDYTVLVNAQAKIEGKVESISAILAYTVASGELGYKRMIHDVTLSCIEKIAKPCGGAAIEFDIYCDGKRVETWVSGIEV